MVDSTTLYLVGIIAAAIGYYHIKGTPVMSKDIGDGALEAVNDRVSVVVAFGIAVGVTGLLLQLLPSVSPVTQYGVAIGVLGFLIWNHRYTTYVGGYGALICGTISMNFIRSILFALGGAAAGYRSSDDDDDDE